MSRLAWTLGGVVVAVAAALVLAVVLLGGDEVDLAGGLAGAEVGQAVEAEDVVVVATIQGQGFFVETTGGPVFVWYGDATDRFGIGTVVEELEGEVAAVDEALLADLRAAAEAEPVDLDPLAALGLYVRADELSVEATA